MPAVTDMLSGQVSSAYGSVGYMARQIPGGRLKLLAVASTERLKSFPDVPTFGEAGYAGINLPGWGGLFLPAATPPAMFAPALLWTSVARSAVMILATMPLVVVLPLVAEMTAHPRASCALRCEIACGAKKSRSFPGALVAPLPMSRSATVAKRTIALAIAKRRLLTPGSIPSPRSARS